MATIVSQINKSLARFYLDYKFILINFVWVRELLLFVKKMKNIQFDCWIFAAKDVMRIEDFISPEAVIPTLDRSI